MEITRYNDYGCTDHEQGIYTDEELKRMYGEDNYRICSECGKVMQEGYCIDDGYKYYCSDECLHKNYTDEEYTKMYENDYGYWTTWY